MNTHVINVPDLEQKCEKIVGGGRGSGKDCRERRL
jgi:hypothetical protein